MNRIRISLLLSVLMVAASRAAGAPLGFQGSSREVISVTPASGTGLDEIAVMYDTEGCSVTYTAASASASVAWQTFDYTGAAYATEVSPDLISRSGADVTLTHIEPDRGYAIIEGGRTYYFWVVDYSAHPLVIDAVYFPAEQECDRTFIAVEGSADRIVYYSITGRAYTLPRGITMTYNTLTADTEEMRYVTTEVTEELDYIESTINVAPPLCNTYFHISGDRFATQWGIPVDIQSSLYEATAVEATSKAEKVERTADNEVRTDSDNLGGSAPVEVDFSAAVTDAAIFAEWQMSADPEFNDITYRDTSMEFTHTFYNMGTTYVRLMVANASGTCEYLGETYTVEIGESSLLCPNAFSPYGSPGVNDEWKVSYKSIISFECYIFNRWGKKLAEFHDPSQGWDGKSGGKLVPAGVYYYVIKARGSDGRDYNLSGDINIVGYSE